MNNLFKKIFKNKNVVTIIAFAVCLIILIIICIVKGILSD